MTERKMGMPQFEVNTYFSLSCFLYKTSSIQSNIQDMCKSKKIRSMVTEERFKRSRMRNDPDVELTVGSLK